MVQPVYATPEQLAAHPGVPSIEGVTAEFWLRKASKSLDVALIGAVYEVDADTQMPTDPDLAEAFADAVVAQAAYLIDVGDTTGAQGRWDSVSIGQVSYRGGAASSKQTGPLCEAAAEALSLGLLTYRVRTY